MYLMQAKFLNLKNFIRVLLDQSYFYMESYLFYLKDCFSNPFSIKRIYFLVKLKFLFLNHK
jgi:hypothetical protein